MRLLMTAELGLRGLSRPRPPSVGASSAAGSSCSSPPPSPTTWSRPSSRSPRAPGCPRPPDRLRLDSVIEVSSAAAVAWQFAGQDPEAREKIALRIIAFSFFGLAAYVAVDAIRSLLGVGEAGTPPSASSWPPSAWWSCRCCPRRSAGPGANSARCQRSPTPSRPCCAPTCRRCCSSAWCSTASSAGPGPTRSPRWSSPSSPSRKASTPGRATPAAPPSLAKEPPAPKQQVLDQLTFVGSPNTLGSRQCSPTVRLLLATRPGVDGRAKHLGAARCNRSSRCRAVGGSARLPGATPEGVLRLPRRPGDATTARGPPGARLLNQRDRPGVRRGRAAR